MCGLAGFLCNNYSFDNWDNILLKMGDSLSHRGPDDKGIWIEKRIGVGLSHRRLSIHDLSKSGHQPMFSSSSRYVVAYNGEIYNFQQLRLKLLKAGLSFQGNSDTEVLLAAIEKWGLVRSLRCFEGMFAIALFDRKKKTLSLIRDRIGEKPLYYGWQGKGSTRTFLFGSELKALRAHPTWNAEVSRNSLSELLRYNYIPSPKTIYSHIYKLSPGCLLNIQLINGVWNEQGVEKWWSLEDSFDRPKFSGTFCDAVDELDNLLRGVISDQNVADVPVGAFLSGGIDSSTIVGIMQSISSRSVNTFTVGYSEKNYDESTFAKSISNHLSTNHTELITTPKDALSIIPELPNIYDEPFSDASQIPTVLISKLASEKVSVSLSGDGGDEVFGGYNRYVWAPIIIKYLKTCPKSIRQFLAKRLSTIPSHIIDKMFFGQTRHPVEKIQKISSVLAAKGEYEFYSQLTHIWKDPVPVKGAEYERNELFKEAIWNSSGLFSEKMMRYDMCTYLPDDILVKVDRAAMHASLENRSPFLNHRIIEFAESLPLNMKINSKTGKLILREVLYKYVPSSLFTQGKSGFAIPIDSWLRGPLRDWAEELISEDRLKNDNFFDVATVRNIWNEHVSGRGNYQYELWGVLMFQGWLENNKKALN